MLIISFNGKYFFVDQICLISKFLCIKQETRLMIDETLFFVWWHLSWIHHIFNKKKWWISFNFLKCSMTNSNHYFVCTSYMDHHPLSVNVRSEFFRMVRFLQCLWCVTILEMTKKIFKNQNLKQKSIKIIICLF